MFQKYDVVMADFNPRKGHAQAGIRPCVVIQSNLFNRVSPTVIVVPLTTVDKKVFPSEFWIEKSKVNGLTKRSRFLGSQIMTIDVGYVSKKMGKLEVEYYEELKEALSISLDWKGEF